jgi:uncharacterized protein (DUF736 family)
MAIIGIFTKQNDGSINGTISTLTINIRASFVPAEKKSENAPDYRVVTNKFEIGAAWVRTSNDRTCLSVKLDDPFAAPVFASLIEGEDKSYQLIWSRRSVD